MSLLRTAARQLVRPSTGMWRSQAILRPNLGCVVIRNEHFRLNSSISKNTPSGALTAQVFPIDRESISEADVDEWLDAVRQLRGGKTAADSELEVYIQQLADPEPFLVEKFEPTEEQLAQIDTFAQTKIPLMTDPVIDNFTNLIMRHGKKLKAHKVLSRALYMVYLKTRKDPVALLHETLDKLGPLMTTKVQKTGAAKSRTVPFPLNKRQRNRFAITWILEGASKKKSPDYSVRLAEEIIAAFGGKLSGYDRKAQMHKMAISQRAYIRL